MKTENEKILTDAIDRSRSLSEITNAEYIGDSADLMVDLDQIYEGEIDSCDLADNQVDVWGFTDETPENQMDWRLTVTLKYGGSENED